MQRIAHRGANREFPENSIPAFRRAFERGADALELDVHATADGIVVVHHDPVIHSDRARRPIAIAESTWDALRGIEIAPDAGLPRLEDVIAITPEHATLYVEIKGEDIEELVARVLMPATIRRAVHSFNHAAIARLREVAPDLPRGVLFERRLPEIESLLRRTGARDVWPHWSLIDEPLVTLVHDLGARVIAWTVNDADVASRLATMGVDGLCGDDVRVFERADR